MDDIFKWKETKGIAYISHVCYFVRDIELKKAKGVGHVIQKLYGRSCPR